MSATEKFFSLDERLKFGTFTIAEACQLASVSQSKLYKDIASGELEIRKRGTSTFISGPDLARYMRGAAPCAANTRRPAVRRRKFEEMAAQ